MFSLTVLFSNQEPRFHKFKTFRRAIRKIRQYQQQPGCVCVLSIVDIKQQRYVVQRYTNNVKDSQIELVF